MQKIKDTLIKTFTTSRLYWPIVVITYVVTRLATWLYPYDSDHWIFYYVGKNWFHGGQLYLTAWDHKPPLIFLINGLMSVVLGDNIILHRIFFTLVSVFSAFLMYRLLSILVPRFKIKPEKVAVNIGLLFFVLVTNMPQFTSSANNTENFALPFFIGMLIYYFKFRENKSLWQLFVSGICLSFMFFLKGNLLLFAVPVGLMIILGNLKNIKKIFIEAFIFGLPLIIHTGLWVWYFSAQNRFKDFWIATYQFSAKYSSSAWSGQLSDMKLFYSLVLFASPIIIFTPLYFLLLWRKNKKSPEYTYFALSIIFGSAALFAVGVPYLYYFMVYMPVITVAAVSLMFEGQKSRINRFFKLGVFAVLIIGIGLNFSYDIFQVYSSFRGKTLSEAKEYRAIAEYIDQHTTAKDKVFVDDYGATFYQLSHRDSGSRFVSASVLNLDYRGNYGFKLNDIFISDMEKTKAKYVVVYKNESTLYYKNIPVIKYIKDHYCLEKSFDKFEVLVRVN